MRRILEKLGQKQKGSTIIICDNKKQKGSTIIICDSNFDIELSKNPFMHGRSKHINVRFHFL